MKARLEGTSTIQYLVLCMRIHTRGWHAINTKRWGIFHGTERKRNARAGSECLFIH